MQTGFGFKSSIQMKEARQKNRCVEGHRPFSNYVIVTEENGKILKIYRIVHCALDLSPDRRLPFKASGRGSQTTCRKSFVLTIFFFQVCDGRIRLNGRGGQSCFSQWGLNESFARSNWQRLVGGAFYTLFPTGHCSWTGLAKSPHCSIPIGQNNPAWAIPEAQQRNVSHGLYLFVSCRMIKRVIWSKIRNRIE